MRCRMLGLLVLLAAASLAQADYAVFIVNLNAKTPPPSENNNLGGLVSPTGVPMVSGGGFPVPGGNMLGGMVPPGFPGPMAPTAEDATDEVPFLVVAVVPGNGLA